MWCILKSFHKIYLDFSYEMLFDSFNTPFSLCYFKQKLNIDIWMAISCRRQLFMVTQLFCIWYTEYARWKLFCLFNRHAIHWIHIPYVCFVGQTFGNVTTWLSFIQFIFCCNQQHLKEAYTMSMLWNQRSHRSMLFSNFYCIINCTCHSTCACTKA